MAKMVQQETLERIQSALRCLESHCWTIGSIAGTYKAEPTFCYLIDLGSLREATRRMLETAYNAGELLRGSKLSRVPEPRKKETNEERCNLIARQSSLALSAVEELQGRFAAMADLGGLTERRAQTIANRLETASENALDATRAMHDRMEEIWAQRER